MVKFIILENLKVWLKRDGLLKPLLELTKMAVLLFGFSTLYIVDILVMMFISAPQTS